MRTTGAHKQKKETVELTRLPHPCAVKRQVPGGSPRRRSLAPPPSPRGCRAGAHGLEGSVKTGTHQGQHLGCEVEVLRIEMRCFHLRPSSSLLSSLIYLLGGTLKDPTSDRGFVLPPLRTGRQIAVSAPNFTCLGHSRGLLACEGATLKSLTVQDFMVRGSTRSCTGLPNHAPPRSFCNPFAPQDSSEPS